MGIFFQPYAADRCCLCGSADDLTGEHKVKAALLRSIFGTDAMTICNSQSGEPLRHAQGPKSRAFHFKAPLCGTCNSKRTQQADQEFEHFHREVMKAVEAGNDPMSVFALPRYAKDSAPYLDVFRYFAKLMCCHLAESEGPRPVEVARFATGEIGHNTISLHIDQDPTYLNVFNHLGTHQYAAHGGLAVSTDAKTELFNGFNSSLTLGAVRYSTWIRFGPLVTLAMTLFHRSFSEKCMLAHRATKAGG